MAYRVDSVTQAQAYDSVLRMEALTADIFSDFSGILSENQTNVPNGVKMIVKGIKKGEHKRTISMLRALNGSGVEGRTSQLGNEEDQVTRSLVVYANTYSNAVNTEQYGIDAWDSSYYDIAGKVQGQLSVWHKEIEGKHIRETIVETISANLEAAPTSQTAHINSNLLVADSDGSTSVTYDETLATYITNVQAAVAATPDATNRLRIEVLNDIIDWAARTKEIAPISVNGKDMWILTVPSRQKAFLMDPVANTGFTSFIQHAEVRGPNNRAINYVLGSWGPLLLVEDPRFPNVEVDTATFTVGYKGAGTTDGRTLTAGNNQFDIGMVLGQSAFVEYDLESISMREEIQDYQKTRGVAAVRTTGWNLAEYDDLNTPANLNIVNKGSGIVLFGTN